MTHDQNALLIRDRSVKVSFLLLLLFISLHSYSQDDTISSTTPQVYKNGIKGMPVLMPFVGVFVCTGLSVGYERNISNHHVMEFCGYYYFTMDEMGAKSHSFSIMPGYKYFFVSKNKMLNNSWAGVYLSYSQKIQTTSAGGDDDGNDNGSNRQYYYGIGLSVGKKIYLNKTKRLFLDLGLGVAFNKWFDEPIFSDTKWEDKYINNTILPRPIVQVGWKF